jgi:hypothetical protein
MMLFVNMFQYPGSRSFLWSKSCKCKKSSQSLTYLLW